MSRKWGDILRGIGVCCRTLPPTPRRIGTPEADCSGRARNREEGCSRCSCDPGSPCDIYGRKEIVPLASDTTKINIIIMYSHAVSRPIAEAVLGVTVLPANGLGAVDTVPPLLAVALVRPVTSPVEAPREGDAVLPDLVCHF